MCESFRQKKKNSWGLHVTKHMQIFRNNHPSSPVLNLWPTLSVLQSGPREHRWRLILSWLLYITVLRCWVHLRPPTELSQVLWDPCCCTPTQCSKQKHTTLNNMPADLKITWHMNYIRCCTRRYSLQASLTSPLNSSFSSPCPVCVCVYVYTSSSRRPASQVCVLQLVLWIRPMTDTSYYPAISQHQGGTAPLPTRRRTTAFCC